MSEEIVLTHLSKSPYFGHKRGDTLASLVDASRRYLRTRSNYHLQSAIQMLPMNDHCSLHQYLEMYRTEPIIAQAVDILFMAGGNSEIRPTAPESILAQRNPDLADNAINFMELVYAYMEDDYNETLQKVNLDTILYGEGMAEIMWDEGYGELHGRRVPTRLDSVELGQAVTLIDDGNRIVGYAPYGIPGVFAPMGTWLPIADLAEQLLEIAESQERREAALYNFKLLPKWKVFHQRWMPASDPRLVLRLLEPGRQAWWAKQQVMAVLMALIDEAQGLRVGTTQANAQEVCLYDANGMELLRDGEPVTCKPEPALVAQIANSFGGGTVGLPNGSDVKIVQPSHEMIRAVIEAANYFSQEISTAVAKQFLATAQGARGSEQGAQSHRDMLGMLIAHSQNRQSMTIYTQIHRPTIIGNFGADAAPYAPEVDLGPPSGMSRTPDEIGLLNQSGYFDEAQLPSIDRQLGFVARRKSDVVLPTSARNDVNQLAAILSQRLGQQTRLTLRFKDDQ